MGYGITVAFDHPTYEEKVRTLKVAMSKARGGKVTISRLVQDLVDAAHAQLVSGKVPQPGDPVFGLQKPA